MYLTEEMILWLAQQPATLTSASISVIDIALLVITVFALMLEKE